MSVDTNYIFLRVGKHNVRLDQIQSYTESATSGGDSSVDLVVRMISGTEYRENNCTESAFASRMIEVLTKVYEKPLS